MRLFRFRSSPSLKRRRAALSRSALAASHPKNASNTTSAAIGSQTLKTLEATPGFIGLGGFTSSLFLTGSGSLFRSFFWGRKTTASSFAEYHGAENFLVALSKYSSVLRSSEDLSESAKTTLVEAMKKKKTVRINVAIPI